MDFYPLVDKLLAIGEEVGLTVKLFANCWDARTDRLSTRQRQADLEELWDKYLVKDLSAGGLLDCLVKLTRPHLFSIIDDNNESDFDNDNYIDNSFE